MNCWLDGCAHRAYRSRWNCALCYFTMKICLSWQIGRICCEGSECKKKRSTCSVAIENGTNGREGEFSQRENCNENANSVHGRKRTARGKKKKKHEMELLFESNVPTAPTTARNFHFSETKWKIGRRRKKKPSCNGEDHDDDNSGNAVNEVPLKWLHEIIKWDARSKSRRQKIRSFCTLCRCVCFFFFSLSVALSLSLSHSFSLAPCNFYKLVSTSFSLTEFLIGTGLVIIIIFNIFSFLRISVLTRRALHTEANMLHTMAIGRRGEHKSLRWILLFIWPIADGK